MYGIIIAIPVAIISGPLFLKVAEKITPSAFRKEGDILACNSFAITVGPGCGGKKPCVTESAAIIGIPIFNCDTLSFLAIVNTNGISNTKPTSKNKAIRFSKEVFRK